MLNTAIEQAIAVAVEVKEAAVACSDLEGDIIQPELIAYRGNRPVATVVFVRHEEDDLLYGFALAAWGFDADTLVMMSEAFSTTTEINPLTNEPWRPGEIDQVAKHLEDTGWAQPLILITAANRAGDLRAATLPYRVRDAIVHWDEREIFEPSQEGHWAEMMLRAMNFASSTALVPAMATRDRQWRDRWTAEALGARTPCVVALLDTSRLAPVNHGHDEGRQ